jgi:hypothetical protein
VVPDFKQLLWRQHESKWKRAADVRQQQVTESLTALDKYFWVFAIGGTTLFFVIIGAVGSCLVQRSLKKILKLLLTKPLPDGHFNCRSPF